MRERPPKNHWQMMHRYVLWWGGAVVHVCKYLQYCPFSLTDSFCIHFCFLSLLFLFNVGTFSARTPFSAIPQTHLAARALWKDEDRGSVQNHDQNYICDRSNTHKLHLHRSYWGLCWWFCWTPERCTTGLYSCLCTLIAVWVTKIYSNIINTLLYLKY